MDVLLVGLPHPHFERERLARLRAWARLGDRQRVECAQGTRAELARRMARARVVVISGRHPERAWLEECARRVGTVAVVEEETSAEFVRRLLEGAVEAPVRAAAVSSEMVWRRLLAVVEEEAARPGWRAGSVSDRSLALRDGMPTPLAYARGSPGSVELLLARSRHLVAAGPGGDPCLIRDLTRRLAAEPDCAALYVALGLATVGYAASRGEPIHSGLRSAVEEFRRALDQDSNDLAARLNLVQALVALAEKEAAVCEARAALERAREVELLGENAGHGAVGMALSAGQTGSAGGMAGEEFICAWEEAALANTGKPAAEARAKKALVAWRLHQLLAELTGASSHYFEAAVANPGSPATRAALGSALARAGMVAEAVGHLQWAVEQNPLDMEAARNLYHALGQAGDEGGQRRLARERWLVARMVSGTVVESGGGQITNPSYGVEPWFAGAAPAGDELASIIVVCDGNEELTRRCLESVQRHAREGCEVIVVAGDGVGAGLARARGEYLVIVRNDCVFSEGWLERLIACSLAQWPRVGMVGPLANVASGRQFLAADYGDIPGLAVFVQRLQARHHGTATPVEELEDFCLLMRREVYEALAPAAGGTFDGAEWCRRARTAGFELLVALDVFVHRQCSFNPEPTATAGVAREIAAVATTGTRGGERGADTDSHAMGGVDRDHGGGGALPAVAVGSGLNEGVSLCMIVRNEEENLAECLASVAGLVDEMVIVDTGSTDRTKEIALAAGAKVFDFPWVDSFAAARNESIAHATGEWIFWMDADDRLDEENRGRLRRLFDELAKDHASVGRIANPSYGNVAYVMKCLCLPDHKTGTATVVDHVRLFRNDPRIRWQYRVHEQILSAVRRAGGMARWSDVVIHHTGYQDSERIAPKLERDVRLLEIDLADDPDDPFTLFNLGWSLLKLGRPAEALDCLNRSLARSQPGDSIVRKAFALLIECHQRLGEGERALAVCRRGRRLCPDDAEILFEEGSLLLAQDNLAAAESCFIQLLGKKPGAYFASVDPGLCGYKARHCLGVVYHEQLRPALAVAQWQRVLEQRRDYVPTLVSLGELFIEQEQWDRLGGIVETLAGLPSGQVESVILRAQGHMARKEFEAAKRLLQEAKERFPESLAPRIVLSHALLQEVRDPEAAEAALREVLALDPNHVPTRQNLEVLLHRRALRAAS